jgi:hypothetical protein
MPFLGILRCVALVITDISEERIASIIRETRISELQTTLPVSRNRSTLRRRATRRNIPEDGILDIVFLRSVLLLLVTANVVPGSPKLVTVVM